MAIRKRNLISALLITAMTASIFALPVFYKNDAVDAATKKVKVLYKAGGGKFTEKKYANKSTVTKKVTKGKKQGKAPAISRTGYTFKGWYTKKSSGKKTSTKTKIKKKTTLYARWSPNTYTISFESKEGTTVNPISIKYNSKYGTLPQSYRNGYKLLGWYTADGKKITAADTYKTLGNTTLYAKWESIINVKTAIDLIGKPYSQVKKQFPGLINTYIGSTSSYSELPSGEFFSFSKSGEVFYLYDISSTVGQMLDIDYEITLQEFMKLINALPEGADGTVINNNYIYCKINDDIWIDTYMYSAGMIGPDNWIYVYRDN